jgi:hypothetical protein
MNPGGRIIATERWFIHRGMPQAIVDYSATEDVFTRMAPFLSLVALAQVFLSFGDRFSGWGQAAAFGGAVAVLTTGFVLVNRLRGRRSFTLPDDVELPELVLFVIGPAVVVAAFGSQGWIAGVVVGLVNLAILGFGYLVTRFGVLPMVWWGFMQLGRQLRHMVALSARGLPLLLLFSAFVFLNAEMWQVAHELTPAYFVVVVSLLFAVALGFLALRLPEERDQLAEFASWDEVCRVAEASDAPYGLDNHPGFEGPPRIAPLTRADRINVVLLLMAGQVVQLLVVAAAIGIFYVIFGLFTVREETLLQWTTLEPATFEPLLTLRVFGADVVLTWELLAVAGVIAAFSGLQFAVSALTDQDQREQFFAQVGDEIQQVLAVRALYRAEVEAVEGRSEGRHTTRPVSPAPDR